MTPYWEGSGIQIYHGDCLDLMPALEPESVTLLWTDPPYGHDNHDGDLNARLNEHRGLASTPIANDGADDMRRVVDAMLTAAVPLLRPDSCCCCCCGGGGSGETGPTFAWVAQRMDTKGLQFFHSVIWDKVNPGIGWRFRRQHEMVMVAHRAGGRLAWNHDQGAIANVIAMGPPRDRVHPNEKPLELPLRFIQAITEPGDLVLDPFMGSGTTLRAAKDLGRRAIGIELEERFCEVAAKKLAQGVLFATGAAVPIQMTQADLFATSPVSSPTPKEATHGQQVEEGEDSQGTTGSEGAQDPEAPAQGEDRAAEVRPGLHADRAVRQ